MAGKRAGAGSPTEESEQRALFEWAARMEERAPALAALYHVPNEGKRSRAAGGRQKAQGLKSGVPDICLPVPAGGCHALYIELKRTGGRASTKQKEWIAMLRSFGNRAEVCEGFEEAARVIMDYLGMEGNPYHVKL